MKTPHLPLAAACVAAALLAACTGITKGPAGLAYFGDHEPLMRMIRSGEVGVNDYVQNYDDVRSLPICAIPADRPDQIAAHDELLRRGARLDLPCASIERGGFPLDGAIGIYAAILGQSRFQNNGLAGNYRARIDRYLELGAKSDTGAATKAQVDQVIQQKVAEIAANEAWYQQYLAQQKEKEERERAEARRTSSGSTLMGLATIASMAAGNYANIKSQERSAAATAALPLANVQPIPVQASSQSRTAAAAPSQPRPAQAQVVASAGQREQLASTVQREFERRQEAQRVSAASPAGVTGSSASQQASSSDASSGTARTTSATRATEWGPLRMEAMAICQQGGKGGVKWGCHGPLDNDVLVEDELDQALARQRCAGAERMPMGVNLNGKRWETFRCGRGLNGGDEDIGRRHGLAAIQRQYICPKDIRIGAFCTTLYDGQDKREAVPAK
jgi:hypothetical protein